MSNDISSLFHTSIIDEFYDISELQPRLKLVQKMLKTCTNFQHADLISQIDVNKS